MRCDAEFLKHSHMPEPFCGIKSKTMKYTEGKTSKNVSVAHDIGIALARI